LNKPSLYAAFGDKRQLFQRVVEARMAMIAKRCRVAFRSGKTLEDALRALFEEMVAIDLENEDAPGCLVASSSITEAVVDESLAQYARGVFAVCDREVSKWIEALHPPRGKVSAQALGRLANGVIHDIALRARVGESRDALMDYARDSAAALSAAAG
jgi:AcrR family transcriptional regulator